MTPKDKARELVDKFKNRSIELGESHSQLLAEANALIAVEELIKETSFEVPNIRQRYWQEVKQKIHNL